MRQSASKHSFFLYLGIIIVVCTGLFYWADLDNIFGSNTNRAAELPTRSDLLRKLYKNRKAILVYGTGDAQLTAPYKSFAEHVKSRRRWLDIKVQSDGETSVEELQNKSVFLVGSKQSNRILAELAPELPVQLREDCFTFYGKNYCNSDDIIRLFYPNPVDPQCSIHLISGNSDLKIIRTAREKIGFSQIGDYHISRNGQSLAMGFFSQHPQDRWRLSSENHRDFEKETALAAVTEHFRFQLHDIDLNAAKLQQFVWQQEKGIGEIRQFLGENFQFPVIEYHLYPTLEDKGIITKNTRPSHYDLQDNEIHTAIEPGFSGDKQSTHTALVLGYQLGQPAQTVLEMGLSVYFSQNWREKGYDYWASRLFLSGNAAPLTDLLDNDLLQKESELTMKPLAGTLVAFLLQEWGKAKFIDRYPDWQPGSDEIKELQRRWDQYLKKISAKSEQQLAKDRNSFPEADGFQKGFCHAHEGYQIYNGYMSEKSDQALQKLAGMGTTAISITPFSYMRDPHQPVFLQFSDSPGSENDESVIHAALTAKELKMSVMLKPHIWMGRSWPGEIEMKTEEDWERFFEYYYRWIRHYALLAEMYGIEMLCIGTELSKTTLNQEKRWRRLIEKIRQLYSGQITYAANWGKEFEQLSFWDAFDFIGINCYYPLSKKENPTLDELRNGMADVIAKMERIQRRFGKPVIITEIGFTATPAPWRQPHESARGKSLNLTHQEKGYKAVFSALEDISWLRGIYWWKWPTYLEYGGKRNNDFTPNAKPAEEVVRKWYSKN